MSDLADALAQFERDYLTELMTRVNGNLTQAAKLAELARSTLRDKLRRYGLIEGGTETLPRRVRHKTPPLGVNPDANGNS